MSCPEYKTRQDVFRIRLSSGASYLFQAISQDDMDMWVSVIKTAARGGLDEHGAVAVGQQGLPSLFSE